MQEIENAAAALKTLDANADGKLTRDEYLGRFAMIGRGPGGPGGPGGGGDPGELVSRMMAFDKNNDGKLSRDELPGRMRTLLDRADFNKDGFVDKAELTKHAQEQSARAARMGGGGFGPGGEPPPPQRREAGPPDEPKRRPAEKDD